MFKSKSAMLLRHMFLFPESCHGQDNQIRIRINSSWASILTCQASSGQEADTGKDRRAVEAPLVDKDGFALPKGAVARLGSLRLRILA